MFLDNILIVKTLFARLSCFLLVLPISLGCGSRRIDVLNCMQTGIAVAPPSATADHNAIPPGNSAKFNASATAPPGCATSQVVLNNVTWSVSDTANVSISNLHDQTYGTATCNGATGGPVTVTATGPNGNGTNVSGTAMR